MKTSLIIMAAGMGSRFGGLKQMEPFGPNGETIMDYSVKDALLAGFDTVTVVIKHAMEADFRATVGDRLAKICDLRYAFQELDALPASFTPPPERTRPFGTGQAVLVARDTVEGPFAVINSDDFYGRGSFVLLNRALRAGSTAAMVGYPLENTLTENGTVNRGICRVADGKLIGVTEAEGIDRNSGYPAGTVVSMNMWGFTPDFFDVLEAGFTDFLSSMKNPLKDEYYLPFAVDAEIRAGRMSVDVLKTDEQWYGVTYREDAAVLRRAIADMHRRGLYS